MLIRWHAKARVQLFNPVGTRPPLPSERLTGRRRTWITDVFVKNKGTSATKLGTRVKMSPTSGWDGLSRKFYRAEGKGFWHKKSPQTECACGSAFASMLYVHQRNGWLKPQVKASDCTHQLCIS